MDTLWSDYLRRCPMPSTGWSAGRAQLRFRAEGSARWWPKGDTFAGVPIEAAARLLRHGCAPHLAADSRCCGRPLQQLGEGLPQLPIS